MEEPSFIQTISNHKDVLLKVLPQSFLGLSALGLFYGWGAISDQINERMNPENPHLFKNQHGTFLGVIVLVLLTTPMPLIQYIVSRKLASEFNIHLFGLITCTTGLFLGGIGLQYRLLWLLYLGGAILCGIGELCLFSRVVFNHQLWFNRIGLKNLGSGIFGFFIGVWTVFFFVISVPMADSLSAHEVFYCYAAIIFFLALYPLLSIRDGDFTTGLSSATSLTEAKNNNKDPDIDTNNISQNKHIPDECSPYNKVEQQNNDLESQLQLHSHSHHHKNENRGRHVIDNGKPDAIGSSNAYEGNKKEMDDGHVNLDQLRILAEIGDGVTSRGEDISKVDSIEDILTANGANGTSYDNRLMDTNDNICILGRQLPGHDNTNNDDDNNNNNDNNSNNSNNNHSSNNYNQSKGDIPGYKDYNTSTNYEKIIKADERELTNVEDTNVNNPPLQPMPHVDEAPVAAEATLDKHTPGASKVGKFIRSLTSRTLSTSEDLDALGFVLTTRQLLALKEVWFLSIFQSVMFTPGWGIKLASFSMLSRLYAVDRNTSATISSCYVASYALGRLSAGFLAQRFGSIRAYDVITSGMFVSLMLLPVSLRSLRHDGETSSGCIFFSVFICIIGLLYGGAQALYYSLVFDVFGAVNYKSVFSLCGSGFSIAVVVGGLSSAYSFSGNETGVDARNLAETWFYVMAASIVVGWILVRQLKPFDYKKASLKYQISSRNNLQNWSNSKKTLFLTKARMYVSGRYL